MSQTRSPSLPKTYRALVVEEVGKKLAVKTLPMPDAVHGSVIVKVLAHSVTASAKEAYQQGHPVLSYPTPMVPGGNAVGRIVALGPDATTYQIGQLVLIEGIVRGRDNEGAEILFGLWEGFDPASKSLMSESAWRNGTIGEYARVPLENAHLLDENLLLGERGYTVEDIAYLARSIVALGGLRSIDLRTGETIIVAPATGGFGGSAVEIASAMNAGRTIAAGRNTKVLQRLKANIPRVETVRLTGNVEDDTKALQQWGPPNAFIDFTPGGATNPVHINSCLMALARNGRAVLCGGAAVDIPINYIMTMKNNLTIRGQFMYDGETVRKHIKMAESGILKLGKSIGIETDGKFSLDQWEEAFEQASANSGWGHQTIIVP